MRPGHAALLAILLLGCRRERDIDTQPDEPLIDASQHDGSARAPEPVPEADPRPPGAIYRSELVRATRGGSAAYLMSQLGPEPYRPQGRFEGWVITRVWPGDPQLCEPGCDLEVGDILLSVNGSKLETPEALSAMLERLDEIESIDLTGMRGGAFFEHSHPVLPDPALPD